MACSQEEEIVISSNSEDDDDNSIEDATYVLNLPNYESSRWTGDDGFVWTKHFLSVSSEPVSLGDSDQLSSLETMKDYVRNNLVQDLLKPENKCLQGIISNETQSQLISEKEKWDNYHNSKHEKQKHSSKKEDNKEKDTIQKSTVAKQSQKPEFVNMSLPQTTTPNNLPFNIENQQNLQNLREQLNMHNNFLFNQRKQEEQRRLFEIINQHQKQKAMFLNNPLRQLANVALSRYQPIPNPNTVIINQQQPQHIVINQQQPQLIPQAMVINQHQQQQNQLRNMVVINQQHQPQGLVLINQQQQQQLQNAHAHAQSNVSIRQQQIQEALINQHISHSINQQQLRQKSLINIHNNDISQKIQQTKAASQIVNNFSFNTNLQVCSPKITQQESHISYEKKLLMPFSPHKLEQQNEHNSIDLSASVSTISQHEYIEEDPEPEPQHVHDDSTTHDIVKTKKTKPVHGFLLWQFILNLLLENQQSLVTWIFRSKENEGLFRLVNNTGVARAWGCTKGNPDMSYEKMSRSLRVYYRNDGSGIIQKARNLQRIKNRAKFTYKFNFDHRKVQAFMVEHFPNHELTKFVMLTRVYKQHREVAFK